MLATVTLVTVRFVSRLVWLLICTPLLAQTVSPDTTLSADEQASRFLAQATFGPTTEAIAELRDLGYNYSAWIDREVAKPATFAVPVVTGALAAGQITSIGNAQNRRARNQVMISGNDQLRQRVAYALSQIFVISDNVSTISNAAEGSSSYYDMLLRGCFGSFRDLLMDVTRHPMMGRYLSHYRNRKANATTGTRPDENYARECMQLFSIGLYVLNPDGTYVTAAGGRPVEAYTNEQITEFARVFTGFTDEDNNPNSVGTGTGRVDFPRVSPANYTQPMEMWELQHDTGAKTLLSYPGVRKATLPAGQTGLQDVGDAIDNLVEHSNTGPFIGRLLIQRLVTSNPSDAYVGRVAAAFANNGRGQRGDMVAVIKAILLDAEARNLSFLTDPEHGKLREPFLRVTHLLRACRYKLSGTVLPYDFGSSISENTLGQFPLSSPSVFNFYLPDYQPAGPIGDAGLFAPEFQILNSVFGITTPNNLYNLIHTTAGGFSLDLAPQAAIADNAGSLVDNLDLLLTHGTLSTASREKILTAVNGITPAMVPSGSTLQLTRARMAAYLIVISPDFAVLK
ncbi:DUF1800 domain-containing protein [Oleiharenicola lentus]|uniref:DUF1800 domain-containing protein n=1 Tax=Oleiharenicola lentus TaxID=2508720 RepID=A0A4Q1C4S1_9BACT|nr:DUF1800 domain-containing protein [Oleiharenicola lentus]RXK53424.1 DUF1800 domain-containing protein [Oleiharenicola lentus]